MDLELQKKMLRFLQTGEFQRVGSNTVEHADIRFVCATNRDPLTEVREGRFREDLFYRLHVVPIHLPPLRDRGEDIIDIAEAFLQIYAERDGKSFSVISHEARDLMLSHRWPGNVREVQNAIQQAVVLHHGEVLTADMLKLGQMPMPGAPVEVDHKAVQPSSDVTLAFPARSSQTEIQPLWMVERQAIERAIEICEGNVNKAAGLLEVAPSTIYRKLQNWEVEDSKADDQSCTA